MHGGIFKNISNNFSSSIPISKLRFAGSGMGASLKTHQNILSSIPNPSLPFAGSKHIKIFHLQVLNQKSHFSGSCMGGGKRGSAGLESQAGEGVGEEEFLARFNPLNHPSRNSNPLPPRPRLACLTIL